MAELVAYGFTIDTLALVFSYLKNWEEMFLPTNILGVLQGSISGPILFDLSINDLSAVITIASVYNFADDNVSLDFSKK